MINLRRRVLLWCFIAAAATFMLIDFAQAQTIFYGKLTGTILDDTGQPLPGVAVEIQSEALVTGKRSSVTSAKGTYVFLNLPIGKYSITAGLEGFKSVKQEKISVTAGSSVVVDLKLEPGKIEESVIVTAVGPVVDAKSSTISTNIQSELLSKLPTSRDAFYDLSLSTPGMVSQGKDGSWLPSPSAYGGTSNENIFLVNGVNTTNPRAAAYGSLVRVNYNAVEEVRVIALGSKAEYGNFTGVAIDVLTKSGSNKLHGNLAVYSQLGTPISNQPDVGADMGLMKGNTLEKELYLRKDDQVLRRTKQDYEINFTIGGPIVKDKVWFYGGVDYVRYQNQVPYWKLYENGWGRLADIKLTAEPWAHHRAWVAYHYEYNDADGATWNPRWDPTLTYGVKAPTHSISSQWQWMATGKTILTAKYLGFWRNDKPYVPEDAPNNPGWVNWWKWGPYGVNGNFPYVESQKSSRNTFQADLSHYAEDFLGEHDIKFGIQYTIGRGNWLGGYFQGYANFAYPAPWTQNVNYMKSWYGATGLVFYNMQYHMNPFLTVRTSDQLGFFIDDQWTPTKRLTVNLGLRFDRMTAKYGEGKAYEQPSTPDGINGPPAVIRSRKGTGNIFDFKNLAPRIGITYALTSDMKTIFRANYGRYFLPLSVEYLRRFGPDMPELRVHWLYYNVPFNLVDLNGDNFIDSEEVVVGARYLQDPRYLAPQFRPSWQSEWETRDRSWQLNIADNLKNQHTDQITLNLERELLSDLSVSATYLYKKTTNQFVLWPLNRVTQQPFEYERVSYTTKYGQKVQLYGVVYKDYNGDGVLDGADIAWVNSHIDREVRNMPEVDGKKPHRTYQGLQFVINKRYSKRWQMLGSLLISKSDGMAARAIRQDFNFEGPEVMDTHWLAGLNQTINSMEGPLPFTQKYEFKLAGSYRIPGIETDLGFRFRFNSGRPIWPVEGIPQHSQWGFPAGSVITTGNETEIVAIDPKDPWYLPAERILDLRLDKAFSLSSYGSLRIALDILNVFNERAVTNTGWGGSLEPNLGLVSGITYPSRKFRLSLSFEF